MITDHADIVMDFVATRRYATVSTTKSQVSLGNWSDFASEGWLHPASSVSKNLLSVDAIFTANNPLTSRITLSQVISMAIPWLSPEPQLLVTFRQLLILISELLSQAWPVCRVLHLILKQNQSMSPYFLSSWTSLSLAQQIKLSCLVTLTILHQAHANASKSSDPMVLVIAKGEAGASHLRYFQVMIVQQPAHKTRLVH